MIDLDKIPVVDFQKILEEEKLESKEHRDLITDLVTREQFGGFFKSLNCKKEPTGIVFDYDVAEMKKDIGQTTGMIKRDELKQGGL